MSEKEIYSINVPPQHADIDIIDANETYLFAGRGSLKSWFGISRYIIRRVFEMPRSTGVGVGISFEHMFDNTLPPVKSFLASKGFVEGIHYAIMQPPPEHWPKPYSGVIDPKYKHAWTWYNGTTIQLISLHRKASANGVSAQWGFFDEVKFMNEEELVDEIFPIFRPVEESDVIFKNCSGYMSKFFATDKKADPVKFEWLLKKRDLVDHKKIDLVRALQFAVIEMEDRMKEANKTEKKKLIRQIEEDNARLRKLRSNLVYVAEISADDVRQILGDKWYNDKKRNASEYDWNIIYMNNDPDKPPEGFYPSFKEEVHCYDRNDDVNYDKPLIIACDYQHTVAPIPVAQLDVLPGAENESLNFIDFVYTKYPEGLRAAVRKFCIRYIHHGNKIVYYVYDHTAVGKRGDADEYCKIVKDELALNGWSVVDIYTGQAPGHYQKFIDTKDWMDHKDEGLPEIRMNNYSCTLLKKSILRAAAKTVRGKTEKDKELENSTKYPLVDQTTTTHASDAFDTILDAVLKQKLISNSIEPRRIAFR